MTFFEVWQEYENGKIIVSEESERIFKKDWEEEGDFKDIMFFPEEIRGTWKVRN